MSVKSTLSVSLAGHAGGGPGARDRGKIARADREQPTAVRRRGGHQRVGDRTCPGAVLLGAVEPPAAGGLAGREPGAGRLRGPDTPAASGRRGGNGAEFGEDGQGVGVPFGQPGQGKVFPPSCARTAQRLRVRPPPGSGRFSRPDSTARAKAPATPAPGQRPARSSADRRTRHGQRINGMDHRHPLVALFAARRRARQTPGVAVTVTGPTQYGPTPTQYGRDGSRWSSPPLRSRRSPRFHCPTTMSTALVSIS